MDESTSRSRRHSLEAFARAGIAAVQPRPSIDRVLGRSDPFWDLCRDRGFVLFAFGKASVEMTLGIIDAVGVPQRGLVVTQQHGVDPIQNCDLISAAHPVPDRHSLEAGAAAIALAATIPADVPVVVLVSGGASSLIDIPRPGVTLDDLQLVSALLLRSGAPITTMNIVRQGLSDFKGGGLSKLLGRRPTRTLVISDVVGNDPATIASGPMSTPTWRQGDPWEACPDNVRDALRPGLLAILRDATPKTGVVGPIEVIADARSAAEAASAMARNDGHASSLLSTTMEGDASERARWMLRQAGRGVTVCAGETTVVVRGTGLGGRNQHAALTWAIEVDDPAASFAGIAIGTDGRDGPTDAAGALVDGASATRMRAGGADPADLLSNDDSNRALSTAGDLIPAWPTGTNVGDLWVIVR